LESLIDKSGLIEIPEIMHVDQVLSLQFSEQMLSRNWRASMIGNVNKDSIGIRGMKLAKGAL
jgi:hypothetical protein